MINIKNINSTHPRSEHEARTEERRPAIRRVRAAAAARHPCVDALPENSGIPLAQDRKLAARGCPQPPFFGATECFLSFSAKKLLNYSLYFDLFLKFCAKKKAES
jgi:hypothetical protein